MGWLGGRSYLHPNVEMRMMKNLLLLAVLAGTLIACTLPFVEPTPDVESLVQAEVERKLKQMPTATPLPAVASVMASPAETPAVAPLFDAAPIDPSECNSFSKLSERYKCKGESLYRERGDGYDKVWSDGSNWYDGQSDQMPSLPLPPETPILDGMTCAQWEVVKAASRPVGVDGHTWYLSPKADEIAEEWGKNKAKNICGTVPGADDWLEKYDFRTLCGSLMQSATGEWSSTGDWSRYEEFERQVDEQRGIDKSADSRLRTRVAVLDPVLGSGSEDIGIVLMCSMYFPSMYISQFNEPIPTEVRSYSLGIWDNKNMHWKEIIEDADIVFTDNRGHIHVTNPDEQRRIIEMLSDGAQGLPANHRLASAMWSSEYDADPILASELNSAGIEDALDYVGCWDHVRE